MLAKNSDFSLFYAYQFSMADARPSSGTCRTFLSLFIYFIYKTMKLLEQYEKWDLKLKFRKNTLYIGCGAVTKDLVLEDQKGSIRRYEELKYLR